MESVTSGVVAGDSYMTPTLISLRLIGLIVDGSGGPDRWLATDANSEAVGWGDSPHGALGSLLKQTKDLPPSNVEQRLRDKTRPPVENKPVTLE